MTKEQRERGSEIAILRRVRRTGWAMREIEGKCCVISLVESEPIPGEKLHRQDKRISVGDTWAEVLADMMARNIGRQP